MAIFKEKLNSVGSFFFGTSPTTSRSEVAHDAALAPDDATTTKPKRNSSSASNAWRGVGAATAWAVADNMNMIVTALCGALIMFIGFSTFAYSVNVVFSLRNALVIGALAVMNASIMLAIARFYWGLGGIIISFGENLAGSIRVIASDERTTEAGTKAWSMFLLSFGSMVLICTAAYIFLNGAIAANQTAIMVLQTTNTNIDPESGNIVGKLHINQAAASTIITTTGQHVVKNGDTLNSISKEYGIDAATLIIHNALMSDNIAVGDTLLLP